MHAAMMQFEEEERQKSLPVPKKKVLP